MGAGLNAASRGVREAGIHPSIATWEGQGAAPWDENLGAAPERREKRMLEIITFTGIDRHTDLAQLARIAQRYPRAEFAMLAGSRTGRDDPAYPPLETLWAGRPAQSGGASLAGNMPGRLRERNRNRDCSRPSAGVSDGCR